MWLEYFLSLELSLIHTIVCNYGESSFTLHWISGRHGQHFGTWHVVINIAKDKEVCSSKKLALQISKSLTTIYQLWKHNIEMT
jgi:hypothetical protein